MLCDRERLKLSVSRFTRMTRRTRKKVIVMASLSLAVLAYIGSYMWRSSRGRYEPAVIGLNGVKLYDWAPNGFVTDFRWNRTLALAYLPLYFLDTRFWHTSDDAHGSRYPINKVAAKDIGKVYQASRQ